MRQKIALLGLLVAFAANSIACGTIELPMTLALDSEASSISLALLPNELPLGTTNLEGGLSTNISMSIGIFDILFHRPFSGGIEITELLFGGTELNLIGISTGTLCTIIDEDSPGGGTALVDIWDGTIAFNMELGTVILGTSDAIQPILPDGFVFPIMFSDSADLSFAELIGLALGNADGGFEVSQALDEEIQVDILGLQLGIHITGEIVMATANEFPVGPLLDDCYAFLAP